MLFLSPSLCVVLEGPALRVVDLEDGKEIGKVQALADPFVQVQELQLRTEALADLQARHQLARARAVEGRHPGEVEGGTLPTLGRGPVPDGVRADEGGEGRMVGDARGDGGWTGCGPPDAPQAIGSMRG